MYLVKKTFENAPEFLKSERYQNVSCTVDDAGIEADEHGRKFVPAGTLLDKAGKAVEVTRTGDAEDSYVYGVTAEELELRRNPAVDISEIGKIIVCEYNTVDPVAKWIKAVATALPSFPYADQVFVATVS